MLGAAQGSSNPLRPLAATTSGTAQAVDTLEFEDVDSLDALEAALAQASHEGRPVFAHFTADWCISCKLMERDVYPTPQVAEALNDFQLISVDVTKTNTQSRELLDHFQLFGPPSLLLFDQGQEVREARIQGGGVCRSPRAAFKCLQTLARELDRQHAKRQRFSTPLQPL